MKTLAAGDLRPPQETSGSKEVPTGVSVGVCRGTQSAELGRLFTRSIILIWYLPIANFMTSELQLYYNPGSAPQTSVDVWIFDLMQNLSAMNAKNHEYTTRDGHVQGVLADITIKADTSLAGQVITAPNSWKMRNAFRKFHFARDRMFREAGVTSEEMGRYGQTVRPYLDLYHASAAAVNAYNVAPLRVAKAMEEGADTSVPFNTANGGEWTRTSLVSAQQSLTSVGVGSGMDMSDAWSIHICDQHDRESTTPDGDVSWGSVGMIQAYNEDRMEVVTPDSDEAITGPNNPLAQLRTQDVTTGDVTEIALDQELEAPPYDIADAGTSIQKVCARQFQIIPNYTGSGTVQSKTVLKNVFIPAGLFLLSFASQPNVFDVLVDVKGIFECREYSL